MARVPIAALAAVAAVALLCGAAAQTNTCSSPAAANCNLPQCPCAQPPVNHQNGSAYRPPGCTAQALPDTAVDPNNLQTVFDATVCRIKDDQYPEPDSRFTPHQIHVMPAGTSLCSSRPPDNTYTYFYLVWATGYAVDLLPELPTTTTYNKSGGVPATPAGAQSFAWVSTNSKAAGARAKPAVTYIGNANNRVYKSTDNQYFSPLLHTVKIGPLTGKTTYYYVVGDPSHANAPENGVSAVLSFTTPPVTGAKNQYPFVYGHVADLGQTLNSSQTLSHLKDGKPQAIMLHGDLSYADDYQADNRFGYQPRWDVWGRFTQSVFSTIPLATCMGNHEEESEFVYGDDYTMMTMCNFDSRVTVASNNCALSWRNRYPTPYAESGSTSPYWYSYNLGPAHVIHLSNYSPSCNSQSKLSASCLLPGTESPQYTWLKADLANVNRANTPWLFVSFHEPYYSSQGTYGQATYFKDNLEALFYQNGVDIIFTGHVHAYERTYPVYNGIIDECAPLYVCVGDGGNEEGPDDYSAAAASWSAFRESSFGHGLLTVSNATTAAWSWIRNQDSVPVAADKVTIQRPPNGRCANRKPITG